MEYIENKIERIKGFREEFKTRFGVTLGLVETKTLVEQLIALQGADKSLKLRAQLVEMSYGELNALEEAVEVELKRWKGSRTE